ncbi:hypothetical protein CEXT_27531 [Caerostris extrusa]|uniref:Uncharacterized protein n=1 Tax=Caerostris extrusa TaxID=172846 RepID=A0AAV4T2H0_CAEEX|nr:hypothetical protein CEXT_27531 [Caerostris extrusa]
MCNSKCKAYSPWGANNTAHRGRRGAAERFKMASAAAKDLSPTLPVLARLLGGRIEATCFYSNRTPSEKERRGGGTVGRGMEKSTAAHSSSPSQA